MFPLCSSKSKPISSHSSKPKPISSCSSKLNNTNWQELKNLEQQKERKKGKLYIIHFNDVYNIDAKDDGPGGAARFVTATKQFRHKHPMIIFSGDIFNPSMLSTFTKGEHMIPVLNRIGVHVGLYGNHDFDFGLDVCLSLSSATSFPWLLSNVLNLETNRPLAEGKITYITQWSGKKVGFMGLVEDEWLETLSTINADEVVFKDYVEMGRKLGSKLIKEGCDIVIALTHMRKSNDLRLLHECIEIDLILGGHDHDYQVHKYENRWLIKSGTDFQEFSFITLKFTNQRIETKVERIEVTPNIVEDPFLNMELDMYREMAEAKSSEIVAYFDNELDGRFSSVRSRETNLGNFVCDIMLASTNSDCAIYNSGGLRSNSMHGPGAFTMKDLMSVLPMMDGLVVMEASGKLIYEALENSVSKYPQYSGRFPQVAGLSFVFDPEKPKGQRVNPDFIKIGDEFLDMSEEYKLTVPCPYMSSGKDGYKCLTSAPLLQDAENSPVLRVAVLNHFQASMSCSKATVHRQSTITTSRRHSTIRNALIASGFSRPDSVFEHESTESGITPKNENKFRRSSIVVSHPSHNRRKSISFTPCAVNDAFKGSRRASMKPGMRMSSDLTLVKQEPPHFAPVVEGRIREETPQIVEELRAERAATLKKSKIEKKLNNIEENKIEGTAHMEENNIERERANMEESKIAKERDNIKENKIDEGTVNMEKNKTKEKANTIEESTIEKKKIEGAVNMEENKIKKERANMKEIKVDKERDNMEKTKINKKRDNVEESKIEEGTVNMEESKIKKHLM